MSKPTNAKAKASRGGTMPPPDEPTGPTPEPGGPIAPVEPDAPQELPDMPEDSTWAETVEQANSQNLKRFVDEWAEVSHNKASQQAGLQDQVNSLFLKWAMDAQGITNRAANDGASVSTAINSAMALASARGSDQAAAMQGLVLAAALGQQISANKMSAEVASADVIAKKAIDAAIAAVPGTGAPAQGTTGVAQGGVQTVGAVASEAIMAQITKLAEVVNVLTLKVAALEVNPAPTG
jgi:hypothetical protein